MVESLRDKGSSLPKGVTHIAAESQSQLASRFFYTDK